MPLIPAYAITGTIKNSAGEPIIGGRVEAISIVNGDRSTSITNDSDIYYLKGLQQGDYRIMVGGLATKIADCTSACNERISISSTTYPVQELNLIPQQPTSANPSSFHHSGHHLATRIDISINY